MTIDEKLSQQIFQKTKQSWLLRHAGVFFASDLIWVTIGFVAGAVFVMNSATFQMEQVLRMVMLVAYLVVSWMVTAGIARMIQRRRPYSSQGYTPIIKPFIETSSFPSSHATFSLALVGYAAVIGIPWLVWPVLIAALFVCLGRVMVGVHRISEVIAGAFVGFATTSTISLILIILLTLSK